MGRNSLGRAAGGDARLAIVETAVELFHQRGYHGTSLDDIAADLGVTKGAIYYHFGRKSEILHVIHDRFIEVLLGRIRERTARGGDPVEEMRCIIGDIMWLMEHMPHYVRVFFEEIRELEDDQFPAVRAKRDAYAEHVRQIYDHGVATGVFRKLPGMLPVFALFGMANWSYQWYHSGGPLNHEQVANGLSDIFLKGVLSDPQHEPNLLSMSHREVSATLPNS